MILTKYANWRSCHLKKSIFQVRLNIYVSIKFPTFMLQQHFCGHSHKIAIGKGSRIQHDWERLHVLFTSGRLPHMVTYWRFCLLQIHFTSHTVKQEPFTHTDV